MENVTIRLDAETLAAIDELARLDDRSRSYVIRQFILDGLKRDGRVAS